MPIVKAVTPVALAIVWETLRVSRDAIDSMELAWPVARATTIASKVAHASSTLSTVITKTAKSTDL